MNNKYFLTIISILAVAHMALLLPAFQSIEHFKLLDSFQYLELANNMINMGKYIGLIFPDIDLVRPPVYPVFISAGLLVTPDGRLIPLMQTVISFATAYLLYRIGGTLGNKKVGQVAVILYMLNPKAAFWTVIILTETLTAFWLLLGFWMLLNFLQQQKMHWLITSGISFGLAALTRPIVYPLIYVLALFLLLIWWFQRNPLLSKSMVVRQVVVFLLSGLVLVFAWQTRNLLVHQQLSFSSAGDSTFQNWLVGKAITEMKGIPRDQAVAEITAAPDPFRYSLEFVIDHPVFFLKTQIRGIMRILLGSEYGTWAKVSAIQDVDTTGILTELTLSRVWNKISTASAWFWAGIYAPFYDLSLYGLMSAALIIVFVKLKSDRYRHFALLVLVTMACMIISPQALQVNPGSARLLIPGWH